MAHGATALRLVHREDTKQCPDKTPFITPSTDILCDGPINSSGTYTAFYCQEYAENPKTGIVTVVSLIENGQAMTATNFISRAKQQEGSHLGLRQTQYLVLAQRRLLKNLSRKDILLITNGFWQDGKKRYYTALYFDPFHQEWRMCFLDSNSVLTKKHKLLILT